MHQYRQAAFPYMYIAEVLFFNKTIVTYLMHILINYICSYDTNNFL